MKRVLFFIPFCLLLFVFFCFVYSESLSVPIAKEDVQNYLQVFFRVFNEKMENRFGLNSTSYSENLHYEVYVTVSSTRGVAIEFFPCNKSAYHFRTINTPIERAIFPNLSFNVTSPEFEATVLKWGGEPNGTMVRLGNMTELVLKNMMFITNWGHFLELGKDGEIYLFDVTVDGRYYHALIIRGGNAKEYWTKDMAEKDATKFFEYKSFFGFQKVQTIREIMAYPIFVELLSEILWKQNNARDIGYTLTQYKMDMDAVRDLAVDTYYFESTYADEVYNWLEKITPKPLELPKPKWYETAPFSWIIGGLVSLSLERVIIRVYPKNKIGKKPKSVKAS